MSITKDLVNRRSSVAMRLGSRKSPDLVSGRLTDHVEQLLSHAIDLGILGTLFLAPLFLGGRHDMGRLVLVCIVGFTVACCTVRKLLQSTVRWSWTGLEWIALLSVGLLILQVTPLSASVLSALSPHMMDLLPTWDPQSGNAANFGQWNRLSLTPERTRGALTLLLSYWLLFFVVADHIQSLKDVQRILKWIALAAISMAVIGLAQRFVGNGKFLWIYEHPSRDTLTAVKGAFTNQNHFAHFLALGVAPLILWVRSNLSLNQTSSDERESRRRAGASAFQLRDIALMAGLGLVIFAGLLSFSRGGIAAIFLASCVAVVGLAWIGMLDRRAVLGVALVGGVITAAACIFGYQPLARELSSVDQAQSLRELLSVRLDLWQSMLTATAAFPFFGTGAASHSEVYKVYCEFPSQSEFSHGENGYIQVVMETGIVGTLTVATLIGLLTFSVIKWFRDSSNDAAKACMIATAAGLAASAAHSFVDFVWYIPACFTLTVVLLAIACRIRQLNSLDRVDTKVFEPNYAIALTVGLSVLLLCGHLIHHRVGPAMATYSWDQYFALSKHTASEERHVSAASGLNQDQRTSSLRIREMKRLLLETLRWDPTNARAMIRLASLDMRQFKQRKAQPIGSMPLTQIVDVAQSAEFENKAARDQWLERVLGDQLKLLERASILSEHSIRFSPLEGRGYLLLAETGQLFGWTGTRRTALLEQASQVRPYDELVLYKRAIEKLRLGDTNEAMVDWKSAFSRSSELRTLAIDTLAPIYSSEQLAELLKGDWESLYQLYGKYKKQGRQADASYVARPLAQIIEAQANTESGGDSAQLFSRAADVYSHLGQHEDSVRCLQKSANLDSSQFAYRIALGGAFMKTENYDEALTQFKWCRRRQPKNESVVQRLETAYRLAVIHKPTNQSSAERIRKATKKQADPSIQR